MAVIQKLLNQLTQAPQHQCVNSQAPGLRLINYLLLILVIILTQHWLLLWGLALITLFKLCQLPTNQLLVALRQALIMSSLAICLILPSLWWHPWQITLFFIGRTLLLMTNLAYFLQTMSNTALIIGLRQLKCPNLLILTFEITLKYSHVLAQFLQESLWAVQLRANRPVKYLVGSIIGRLYLNAKSYINELYQAMLLRGYSDQKPAPKAMTFKRTDWRYLIGNLGLLGLLILIWGSKSC